MLQYRKYPEHDALINAAAGCVWTRDTEAGATEAVETMDKETMDKETMDTETMDKEAMDTETGFVGSRDGKNRNGEYRNGKRAENIVLFRRGKESDTVSTA